MRIVAGDALRLPPPRRRPVHARCGGGGVRLYQEGFAAVMTGITPSVVDRIVRALRHLGILPRGRRVAVRPVTTPALDPIARSIRMRRVKGKGVWRDNGKHTKKQEPEETAAYLFAPQEAPLAQDFPRLNAQVMRNPLLCVRLRAFTIK